jgi:hypothetical protein
MKDLFVEGNVNLASFGQFGLRVLTEAAEEGETFVAVQVLEDATITATLLPYVTPKGDLIGDSAITDLSLTAGTVIYGRFVNLIVDAGKVIAYKG